MSTGIVANFNEDRGFGFIKPAGGLGGDVFVHARDLVNADKLKQGQSVTFEVIMDEKRGKERATKVRAI